MIYVIVYHTESGDRGVIGYFDHPIDDAEASSHLREEMPCEFEGDDPTVTWTILALDRISFDVCNKGRP